MAFPSPLWFAASGWSLGGGGLDTLGRESVGRKRVIATALSALAGVLVAVGLALGGTAALTPSVHHEVPHSQMVKYGDNGHF